MFGGRLYSIVLALVVAAALAAAAQSARAQQAAQDPRPAPAPGAQARVQDQKAAPPAAEGQEGEAQITNVGGRWELNWRMSDRAPQVEEPGRGERGGRSGGPPPGGGGTGGGTGGRGGGFGGMGGFGRGGRGGDRGQVSAETVEQTRDFTRAPRTLLIVEHKDHVSITDENGQVEKLVPNGEKIKDERAGKPFERRTHWDGRTLVTEVDLSGGVKIMQTYQKAAEGLQLVVTTKVEGSRLGGARELKRVYDQALEPK